MKKRKMNNALINLSNLTLPASVVIGSAWVAVARNDHVWFLFLIFGIMFALGFQEMQNQHNLNMKN